MSKDRKQQAKRAAREGKRAATRIERADIAAGHAAARFKDHGAVKVAGAMSEVADQPPLVALSIATLGAGLVRGDRRLARAGGRMLAAHALATFAKTLIKQRIDRARPGLFRTHSAHRITPGDHDDGPMNSFPSGHTAGIVAVTRAAAREYPESAVPGTVASAAIAGLQPARGTHFPLDIVAGAVIGVAAEWLVARAFDAVDRRG